MGVNRKGFQFAYDMSSLLCAFLDVSDMFLEVEFIVYNVSQIFKTADLFNWLDVGMVQSRW